MNSTEPTPYYHEEAPSDNKDSDVIAGDNKAAKSWATWADRYNTKSAPLNRKERRRIERIVFAMMRKQRRRPGQCSTCGLPFVLSQSLPVRFRIAIRCQCKAA